MAVDLEPQDVCDQVLQVVRSSQLNFCSQETPYSVFLTLRKSFTKNFKHPTFLEPFQHPKLVKNSNLEIEVHFVPRFSIRQSKINPSQAQRLNV